MKVIQAFEHELLKVGDNIRGVVFEATHFQSLADFSPTPYFQVQHQSIRCSHYVGMIQLDDFALEILPKADLHRDKFYWKRFLMAILAYCKVLKFNTLPTQVEAQSDTLLEDYLIAFLDELALVLTRGLVTTYATVEKNQKALCGQLLVAQQIKYNLVHQERFYVRKREKTHDTLPNQILFHALLLIKPWITNDKLYLLWQACFQRFPSIPKRPITTAILNQVQPSSLYWYYSNALEYARQIIENEYKGIFKGTQSGASLMFDMNLLFEDYLFRQLQAACPEGVKIFRQQRQYFWQERFIRPDILIQTSEQTIVLDTKWKILERIHPAMSDIQQAFVYGQYFGATKTVLVYPKVHPLEDLPPTPFQPTSEGKTYFCEIRFVEIIDSTGLNLNLGKQLLDTLLLHAE